jgi:ABC-type sugar transport system substrate-binding protein
LFTGLVLGGALLPLLAGCDSMSFTPPRPPGLAGGPGGAAPIVNPTSTTTSPSPAPTATTVAAASTESTGSKTPSVSRTRLIELLLAHPPGIDRQYLAQFLRRDAGVNKCGFRFTSHDLKKPMTPAQLAEAIRAAAARSTGALILEPIDAPEVTEALHEAEARGLPIVLLDSSLPASSPGKFYPVVSITGFPEAGKQIVEAVIDDAQLLNLPADSAILVLEYHQKDFYSKPRLDSLISALKAAGRKYEVVTYDGDQTVALELAKAYVKDHPKTSIILADYDFGITAAYQTFAQVWKESKRSIVRGGYGACDIRLDEMIVQMTEAVADRNMEAYSRKALLLALDMMAGKAVPERIDLPVRFIRNPHRNPPSLTPQMREKKGLPPEPPNG